jgi:hypothetical protein
MYANITRTESTNIMANILKRNSSISYNSQKEVIHILETIMKQNYFKFEQKFYKQTDGLAMGAPTSTIILEVYIQNLEQKQIYPILVKHQLTEYFRYVDDILVIYDQTKTNIDQTLAYFNEQLPTIKFTIEKESQISINFVDLIINRSEKEIEFEIYGKPTQTHYNILLLLPSTRA